MPNQDGRYLTDIEHLQNLRKAFGTKVPNRFNTNAQRFKQRVLIGKGPVPVKKRQVSVKELLNKNWERLNKKELLNKNWERLNKKLTK